MCERELRSGSEIFNFLHDLIVNGVYKEQEPKAQTCQHKEWGFHRGGQSHSHKHGAKKKCKV